MVGGGTSSATNLSGLQLAASAAVAQNAHNHKRDEERENDFAVHGFSFLNHRFDS